MFCSSPSCSKSAETQRVRPEGCSAAFDLLFTNLNWLGEALLHFRRRTSAAYSTSTRQKSSRIRRRSGISDAGRGPVMVELLEVRQLLTDPLQDAVDGFDAELLAGMATMEAKIREVFQTKNDHIVGNFAYQIDSLFDDVFTVPAIEGSGAGFSSVIDADLHSKKNGARTAVTGVTATVLSLLGNMNRPAGYDWGIPMDPDIGGPRYFYWFSESMILSADALTGNHSAMIIQEWTNPSPDPGIVEDWYGVSGFYSRFGSDKGLGLNIERVKRNQDNSFVDSWTTQFSLDSLESADPDYEISRTYISAPVTFFQHLTVSGGSVQDVQMVSSYATTQLNMSMGYVKGVEEEYTGSVNYVLNDHLEISGLYRQTSVGELFQSGLVYRYNDENWVRAYFGVKDFADPEIEDRHVAGLEMSLLTDDTVSRYYNGTRSRVNSQNSNLIFRTSWPRGSKFFLQLRSELESEQNVLKDGLNVWNSIIGGELHY